MTGYGALPGIGALRALYAAGRLTVPAVAARAWEAASRAEHAEAWIHRVPNDVLMAEARRLQLLLEDALREDAGKGASVFTQLPLLGIPFAVKDNIDVAGVPTTAGCPGYARIPKTSAPAVQRLLDAGALFLGKTNLDQFATGLVGTRSPYGACKNPFDPAHITGGSSSGSALAVATGMVVFALGTDTAGSGRVPAAFCNLTGVKPTRGIVSLRGVVPACPSLDCVSVFARDSADAFEILRVMQGFDAEDPYARRASESAGEKTPEQFPGDFRFGVPRRGQLDFSGDAEYASLFDAAVERMRALGGVEVAVDIAPLLECARLLYAGPWLAERAEAIAGPGKFGAAHPEALLPLLREILAPAPAITAMEAFRGFGELARLRRAAEALWDKDADALDVLLLPTTPTIYTQAQVAADPLGCNATLGRFTNFVNLMDLCAVASPAGFRKDGLPFGITLLAPAFQDATLADAAALWEGRSDVGADSAASPRAAPGAQEAPRVSLLVFGLHLSDQPLNHELLSLGARLERTARTSTRYRMALLRRGEKRLPGVWRQPGATGVALEGELWSLPEDELGAFFARVPAPLCLGSIELTDGAWVKGFLAEASACEAAEDISRYGGWRGWLGEG